MKNKKLLRQISTIGLLLVIVTQIITIILMETANDIDEIEELHEICGFILLGLVLLHIILFRKSFNSLIKPSMSNTCVIGRYK